MDIFETDLPSVAASLISQSKWFNVSREEAWEKFMLPNQTDEFEYEEVLNYINENHIN